MSEHNAYQRGRDAYHQNFTIHACPFSGEVNRLDWKRGYCDARQDQADMDYLNARIHLGKLEPWA